jgi:hypothetical protein
MGTFAKTAIVAYHLSFASQGKQMSVILFRLHQTNGSLPFPFSVAENNGSCRFPLVPFSEFRKRGDMDKETWRHGDMETWTWRHQTENGNGSPGDFPKSIYHLHIVQTVVCHLSIFVDEETNGSYPSANRINGRAHLCNLGYHP